MLQTLKHWYCYLKKIMGYKQKDNWDDNPFIIL